MINKQKILGLLFAGLLLTGCGNDVGTKLEGEEVKEPTKTFKGTFEDSPVANATYSCGKKVAKTTKTGGFECAVLPISINIGGIDFGSVKELPSDGKLYPQHFVGVALDDIDNKEVVKQLVLLQSLATNGDISKSIILPDNLDLGVKKKISEISMEEITRVLANNGIESVSEESAKEHLRTNLGLVEEPSKDIVPPIITILGLKSVTITEGDVYKDAGATANDNVDGVVKVTTTSNVNSSKAGTYTVTYTAQDKAGNKATATRTVIVKAKEIQNQAPTVTIKGEESLSMQVDETIELEGEITDEHMDSITIEWFDNDVLLPNETSATLKYKAQTAKVHTLKLKVTDDDGLTGSDTVTLNVTEKANKAPTVSIEADKTTVKVNEKVSLTANATDSDGTISLYEWKKQDGTVLGADKTLDYTPTEVGTDTLTVTVTDDDGAKASSSIQITVEEIQNSDQDDVDAVKASLSFDDIKGANSNASEVTSDLNLIGVKDGVTISWVSSNNSVIKVNGTVGEVTQPSSSDDNIEVTLTATLSKGNVSESKNIVITVKAEDDSGEDIGLPTTS